MNCLRTSLLAGDDAVRGFLWTHQKYDWMGRVVRKIATDGVDSPTLNDSDVLISYEGCGCAGGLVTTGYRVFSSVLGGELVSIETDQTGERRKVKVYAGEAVVGERSQRTLTGQSPTQAFGFFHADPVTGETSNNWKPYRRVVDSCKMPLGLR